MEFSAANTIWVLLGAALVFFMQAGFAMVETDFTRAKNAATIVSGDTQKGHTNYYRGVKVEEVAFLPKLKLEVV